MTIDEAILELDEGLRALRGYLHKDYNKAISLGIEALKRLEALRASEFASPGVLLPGETEE